MLQVAKKLSVLLAVCARGRRARAWLPNSVLCGSTTARCACLQEIQRQAEERVQELLKTARALEAKGHPEDALPLVVGAKDVMSAAFGTTLLCVLLAAAFVC
jgi:hypothetical protein